MIESSALDRAISLLLPGIQETQVKRQPFILGLSGLQGSGKSTWGAALVKRLQSEHSLNARVISLDDFYLDHDDLAVLRNGANGGIFRTRGLPGTHDIALAESFFSQITNSKPDADDFIKWPTYDKSLNNGQGGRAPVDTWERVPKQNRLDVLIFEGWCLGFQPLQSEELENRWLSAKAKHSSDTEVQSATPTHLLQRYEIADLSLVNQYLQLYCEVFMGPWRFDSFLHLTSDHLQNVYSWRLDQEKALRDTGRPALSDIEVARFVEGYMLAYELYLPELDEYGCFKDERSKCHIQVALDRQRKVVSVTTK